MQDLDLFSYRCGVIDCFNEMVAAGVKGLALSHPVDTREELDALVAYAHESCRRYHTKLYPECDQLVTDLFPASLNRGSSTSFSTRPTMSSRSTSVSRSARPALWPPGPTSAATASVWPGTTAASSPTRRRPSAASLRKIPTGSDPFPSAETGLTNSCTPCIMWKKR